ncbi:hypothetical protein B0T11DRAFT_80979 [Plectosphaerella cucumerina]|uniref:WSC domain-containing protein n=1 Tax=Plectosphaerella cucumerina TaxID=40658 RepID=A0A8K0TGN6_9PEZI|nr:hypothetical protein B0T11DRAFT_80979 [Plectosphaerella cucumerina]
MKFTTSVLLAFAATAEHAVAQLKGVQPPIASANVGGPTSQGCFKSKGGDWDFYEVQAMSTGACHGRNAGNEGVCYKMKDKKYTVSAATPDGCYCGYEYPPKADLIDDSKCNFPCPAYDDEACGGFTDAGKTFYSVFNVGIKIAVPYMDASSSTTTSSAVTDDNAPAATSASNQPASSSSSSSPANDGDKSDDGPSIGGIVGGVVAGVAVVGILGAIAFFIWRRRRNQAIEDEHRRNATVNSFISGAKPTSSSGVSMTDSRMDPGMAHQRRLSDGSIADNQDYSRKILRVTNA